MRRRLGDHPRICGENLTTVAVKDSMVGSPPHMRGKRRFVIASEIAVRITPAYAGKTPFFFLNGQIRKDHPRICGENPYVALKKGYLEGSPPHMRGKH